MNILLVINGNTGLQYHRQIIPHASLFESYPNEITYSITKSPETLPVEEIEKFDIVHVLREVTRSRPKNNIKDKKGNWVIHPGDGKWLASEDQKFIDNVKRAGKKLVFDIDDNWQLPSFHGLFEANRIFNVESRTNNILKQSDIITTTTTHFAEYISTVTTNPVEVLPNCIYKKDSQWTSIDITSPLVRFGWIGGTHHRQDIELLQPGIARAYNEMEDFQFCLSFDYNPEYLHHEKIFTNNYNLNGDYVKFLNDQLAAVRVAQSKGQSRPTFVGEHYSYHQPYRRLWSKDIGNYATLYNDIDVALIPLRSNNFNKYKSELKLIEAGAMGKAAIATKVKPYDHFPSECVRFVDEMDMNNGWIDAMKEMMNDEVRERYANNLQEYVNDYYNIEKWSKKRYEIYNKLIG